MITSAKYYNIYFDEIIKAFSSFLQKYRNNKQVNRKNADCELHKVDKSPTNPLKTVLLSFFMTLTHKLISLFIAMLLTVSYVAASGLTSSGVYYDPVQAD